MSRSVGISQWGLPDSRIDRMQLELPGVYDVIRGGTHNSGESISDRHVQIYYSHYDDT